MSRRADAPVPAAAALPRLRLAQWPADAPAAPSGAELFRLDTCLRQLRLGLDRLPGATDAAEQAAGSEAYRRVLEVITGLDSPVPGETNVGGQFRQAVNAFAATAAPRAVAELGPLLRQARADAAAIRRAHLEGIGGASYGSLVRRLLEPRRGERVLWVGYGEFARSLLPFFRAWPCGVWNRRPVDAAGLVNFAPAEGAAAAAWADHVVMTTPPDPANDARWQAWLAAAGCRSVVRLGHRRGAGSPLPATRAFDLDHVFELRASRANIRSLELARARAACGAHARALAAAAAPADPARVALGA